MINPLYFKLAGVALVVYGTWYVTSDHYQKQIVEIQLSMAQAVQGELLATQEKVKAAGEQHAKDQLRNNDLARQLAGVQVSGICTDATPGSADSNGDAGVLSNRVDEAFAELQAGVSALATRCDQLNIDAIASNKSQ